jgi:hypothetical protein
MRLVSGHLFNFFRTYFYQDFYMARYTCRFSIPADHGKIRKPLCDLMKACNMEIIYEIEDYIMGRENPGGVSFAKLVTTEILIDITIATADSVGIKLVVKNEELPLKVNNHCQQVFQEIQTEVVKRHADWILMPDEEENTGA